MQWGSFLLLNFQTHIQYKYIKLHSPANAEEFHQAYPVIANQFHFVQRTGAPIRQQMSVAATECINFFNIESKYYAN